MVRHPSESVEASGPWRFVTRRDYVLRNGQHYVWQSRKNRKGLQKNVRAGLADTRHLERLNAWIGWGFAIGSAFFIAGSVLSLDPTLPKALGLSAAETNAVYFVGSIFFTAAAYLQLYQAANAGGGEPTGNGEGARILIGWQLDQIGWLSSFLQFIGTLLFNLSTYMAIVDTAGWLRQDLTVWVPDVFGSVLFLCAGYLAFAETSHGYWSWRPADTSWWVVSVNLAGCLAFMASAIYAFVPSAGAPAEYVEASLIWTLSGAIGFLIGSVLMLMEGPAQESPA